MMKRFLFAILIVMMFSSFTFATMNFVVNADNSGKTVTIRFKTNPSPESVVVTKAPLKHNKKFAFSFSTDDGYIEGYNSVYRYLNGGYVSEIGQTVNGLYYSDGSGYRIPFKGDFNWFSNSMNFADLHTDTPGYMTWNELREVYANGWEPINHGWTSIVTPVTVGTIINYPSPHGPSTIDYFYEITQNTARFQAELGATIKHFGLPAGDINYLPAALSNNMKTIFVGQTSLSHNGLMNASTNLNLNNLEISRKYFADQTTLQEMKDYIDNIAETSTNGANYWGVASSHRVRTSTLVPDNGNLSFDNFSNFMTYSANKYGIEGTDTMWMASTPEIYEYLAVKQKTNLSYNLIGDTLTINLDTSLVDADLRRFALSLVINANAEIDSISYGSDFSHHSENKSTGLINLDWGFVSLSNDITRCESLVSAAETSRIQLDVETARTYVNLLNSSIEKTNFTNRINNIVLKLKSWNINFGNNGYSSGIWNEYGGSRDIDSTLTLKDSDGNLSSNTVKIQQSFNGKSSTNGKTATPANSGVFPDAYLQGYLNVYSKDDVLTNVPGMVRLGGLNVNKKYKIVIMGSHNKVDPIPNKTVTVYSVLGVTKELQTSLNTNNSIIYDDISPDILGNIDISVSKKYLNWGYGVINALELSEKADPTPTPTPAAYSVSLKCLSADALMNTGDKDYDDYMNLAGKTSVSIRTSFLSSTLIGTTTADPTLKTATFNIIQNRSYVVTVSRKGYLIRNIAVTIAGSNVDLLDKSLIAGDVYQDGIIDGSDSETLFSTIGFSYGEVGYVSDSDLNLDGIVDGTDSEMLYANLGVDVGIYNENVDYYS